MYHVTAACCGSLCLQYFRLYSFFSNLCLAFVTVFVGKPVYRLLSSGLLYTIGLLACLHWNPFVAKLDNTIFLITYFCSFGHVIFMLAFSSTARPPASDPSLAYNASISVYVLASCFVVAVFLFLAFRRYYLRRQAEAAKAAGIKSNAVAPEGAETAAGAGAEQEEGEAADMFEHKNSVEQAIERELQRQADAENAVREQLRREQEERERIVREAEEQQRVEQARLEAEKAVEAARTQEQAESEAAKKRRRRQRRRQRQQQADSFSEEEGSDTGADTDSMAASTDRSVTGDSGDHSLNSPTSNDYFALSRSFALNRPKYQKPSDSAALLQLTPIARTSIPLTRPPSHSPAAASKPVMVIKHAAALPLVDAPATGTERTGGDTGGELAHSNSDSHVASSLYMSTTGAALDASVGDAASVSASPASASHSKSASRSSSSIRSAWLPSTEAGEHASWIDPAAAAVLTDNDTASSGAATPAAPFGAPLEAPAVPLTAFTGPLFGPARSLSFVPPVSPTAAPAVPLARAQRAAPPAVVSAAIAADSLPGSVDDSAAASSLTAAAAATVPLSPISLPRPGVPTTARATLPPLPLLGPAVPVRAARVPPLPSSAVGSTSGARQRSAAASAPAVPLLVALPRSSDAAVVPVSAADQSAASSIRSSSRRVAAAVASTLTLARYSNAYKPAAGNNSAAATNATSPTATSHTPAVPSARRAARPVIPTPAAAAGIDQETTAAAPAAAAAAGGSDGAVAAAGVGAAEQ